MVSSGSLARSIKGTRLEAPARAFVGWRRPAWRREWSDQERLKLLISYLLREDSLAVDVGAHQGMFLREMVRVAPMGRHVAFEPLPELAAQLTTEFSSVTVHAAAAGSAAGVMPFFRNKTFLTQSGMTGRREVGGQDLQEFEVPVLTLDETLKERPTLIKIDVEGAEGYVLQGAQQVLTEYRPLVWFEHGPVAARECGMDAADVCEVFKKAGMRIFDVDGRGPLTTTDLRNPPPWLWTYIAR